MLKVAFKSIIPTHVDITVVEAGRERSLHAGAEPAGVATMVVCLCKGVSCSVVRRAIAEGATTLEDVGRACGAGTDCGGCENTIEDLIEEVAPSVAPCGRRLPVVRAA